MTALSRVRAALSAGERPSDDDVRAVCADAARFDHLQNIRPVEAQMYFWNYVSRKQRAAAIDAAIREPK